MKKEEWKETKETKDGNKNKKAYEKPLLTRQGKLADVVSSYATGD